MELLLAGYRKVPLACPMPGFRDNLLMLCLMQFLGFEVFTRMGAGMERWMFGQPCPKPELLLMTSTTAMPRRFAVSSSVR